MKRVVVVGRTLRRPLFVVMIGFGSIEVILLSVAGDPAAP